jgi:hypothetical protein
MKNTLFNIKNPIITLKSLLTSIVTMLVIFVPLFLAYWLINTKSMLAFGRAIQILTLIFYLWLWGYFANKFWSWK